MARGDTYSEARVPRVLLGTADESYLKNVRRALQEAGYRVEVALDSETVMASLEPRRYDLAVLDTSLGKIDGLSVFDRLRTEPDGRVLYLIALVDSEESRPLDASIGADDCLTKPFEISDLLTSVHIASRIVTLQRELNFANHRISTLAMTDALTGLPNRQAIYDMLGTEIARQSRESPVSCVALIDIDKFKAVNDNFSHQVGDAVLKHVAQILRSHVRDEDLPARLAGDEFVIMFKHTPITIAQQACARIEAAVRQFEWSTVRPGLAVSISVGVAAAGPGDTVDALTHRSDMAMYGQKKNAPGH